MNMSHYVGVGGDEKKGQMATAKEIERRIAAGELSRGSAPPPPPVSTGMFAGMGDPTTLAIAAAAVGIIGYAVWKKRKKG
jgi:hypothetical protein